MPLVVSSILDTSWKQRRLLASCILSPVRLMNMYITAHYHKSKCTWTYSSVRVDVHERFSEFGSFRLTLTVTFIEKLAGGYLGDFSMIIFWLTCLRPSSKFPGLTQASRIEAGCDWADRIRNSICDDSAESNKCLHRQSDTCMISNNFGRTFGQPGRL